MLSLSPDLVNHIRRWGIIRTGYSVLMRKLKRYGNFVFCCILTRPLVTETIPVNSNPEIEIKLLSEKELIDFSEDPELGMTPSLIRTFIARGHLCVGAVKDNELISYVWRSFTPTHHTADIWIDFNSNCRYGFKSLTKSSFRGQRINLLVSLTTDDLCRKDRDFHISYIETHNYSSLRASASHGDKIVGYAGYWKVFGMLFTFRSMGAKRLGFRFFKQFENDS